MPDWFGDNTDQKGIDVDSSNSILRSLGNPDTTNNADSTRVNEPNSEIRLNIRCD